MVNKTARWALIESHYWRAELKADVRWLRAKRRFNRWTEKQVVLYERKLMHVAFEVRTLLEHARVNDKVRAARIPASEYPKVTDWPFTLLGRGWPEEHFDLESPKAVHMPAWDVCNQLIHHYWLSTFAVGVQEYTSVFVCSDYKRNTCMYEFEVSRLIGFFSAFGDDDSAVHGCDFVWDEKRQDYVMENARGPGDGSGVVTRVNRRATSSPCT
jgi:hypothetical protein